LVNFRTSRKILISVYTSVSKYEGWITGVTDKIPLNSYKSKDEKKPKDEKCCKYLSLKIHGVEKKSSSIYKLIEKSNYKLLFSKDHYIWNSGSLWSIDYDLKMLTSR
jgi:hypothetical protein